MKIITIAQQKGGAGKITVAAHLAVSLMQNREKVGFLDIKPHRSLTANYALLVKKYSWKACGVALVAGAGLRLDSIIIQAKNNYDFLRGDSALQFETVSNTALRTGKLVLVPIKPIPTDAWATKLAPEYAQALKESVRNVLNRVNSNSVPAKKIAACFKVSLNSHLGKRAAFSNYLMHDACTSLSGTNSQAEQEVKHLTAEILKLFKDKKDKKEKILEKM